MSSGITVFDSKNDWNEPASSQSSTMTISPSPKPHRWCIAPAALDSSRTASKSAFRSTHSFATFAGSTFMWPITITLMVPPSVSVLTTTFVTDAPRGSADAGASSAIASRISAVGMTMGCGPIPTTSWLLRASARGELRFFDGGLEQLDRVAGGIFDEDLPTPDAFDDVVAEAGTVGPQARHERVEILDLEREAVPSAGLRH